MKKARPTYLKVSISLDLEQDADKRLLEFSDSLPAGMKANVLRRLLAQSLPTSEAEMQKLLGQVAMDAHLRNQCAGRPRQNQRETMPLRGVVAPFMPQGAGIASAVRGADHELALPDPDRGEIGHVVPVAGPIDEGAADTVPPVVVDRGDRGQGPQPVGAASGVSEKRRLNVGKLIPSFAS